MGDSLIGREGHLHMVRSAFDGLWMGAGTAIAFVGEPGLGKSALLRSAANAARAVGVAVITARGADLVRDGDARAACARIDDAVAGHIVAGRPVMVSVDDVHLLGADHVGLLERLLHSTENGSVLFVPTYRRRQLVPELAALFAGASDGPLQLAPLEPLTREQAGGLLGERVDADEIYREADGNPQYIKVLRSLRDTGGTAEAGAAIFGEVAGLEPEVLAAAQAAAVLAEPFTVALLAEVARLDESAAGRALDRLTRLDLVRLAGHGPRLAMRHRAVVEAVYERLEPSVRRTLHHRAEVALARVGASVAERARHVARAADADRPEHLTTLIAAARGTIYAAPSTAAEYLQAALPLLRDDGHAHEVHVLLARARVLSGEFSEGRALLDALRSTASGGVAVDSTRIERRVGRFSEAAALARSGLAALAETDSATAAALHAELADEAYDVRDYKTSLEHAETAAAIAARHGDRVGEAQVLAQSALGHLFTGDEETAAARATSAAERVDTASDAALLTNLEAALQLGLTEGILGRLGDSERHLARAEALGRRTGQTYLYGSLSSVLANARLRLGKLSGALTALEGVARHLAEFGGNLSEDTASTMLRAEALYWRDGPGDAEQAATEAERGLALASDSSFTWAVTARCFHAELVLRTGDPVRGRTLMLDAAGGEDLPEISPWRHPRLCDALAEAALAVGDLAAVEHWAAIAERAPRRAPSLYAFALRTGMWAHAARGEYKQAQALAEEATREFVARGERIEVCRTLLAAAGLALDAGNTRGVADRLDRVTILAEICGSERLLKEVVLTRQRLAASADARSVVLSSASAMLSLREREIADLVSTGMTNLAIAQTLFLSVRTVEAHLRQIYRKLKVPNRASLTRALLDTSLVSRPPSS